MNKKIIISLLVLSLSLQTTSTELIHGDKDAPEGQTFSFAVNKNVFSPSGNFYEGAHEQVTNNDYAISRLIRGTSAFIPLTPETITFNTVPDTPNPLFGQQIIAIGILETEDGLGVKDMPVAVTADNDTTVYLFEDINVPTKISVVSSHDVHDAQGNVSNGIIDITTDITAHVFAAAKPNSGEFGDLNSGIALLIRGLIDIPQNTETDPKKMRIFSEVNVNTGSIVQPKALLLDATSEAIAINSPLQSIAQNKVALHWDASLERLYIGLQTTSNSSSNDGTRAIAVCKFIENGGIALETIVPDAVFETGNTTHIIGAREANQQVSIHALSTMYTSTALNYLIVVGNVGDPATTQQSVFALPLVNTGDARGMIADKNAQPTNVFKNSNVARLTARTISTPATDSDSMTQATDSAAQVGAGELLAGPIVNIIVRDDTVFAYVGTDTPGIYSSQAIFDATGKITSWTEWQRAAGTTENIFGAALNPYDGNFILATGEDADSVSTIQRTIWSNGSENGLQPLTTILNTTFTPNNGGIQGMQTFLPNSAGLHDMAVLAAGGIGTVLLAQTGRLNENNIIIPTIGSDFNNLAEFTDGIITSDVDAKTVVISGGELNNVGPITALEFAQGINNAWFFVGGSDGLAVLAHPDGSGWEPATELSNNFTGLQAGMRFMKIGDYSFVKKLVSNDDFLFVITHNKIDRINLNNSNFSTNFLDVTTIATIGTEGVSTRGSFLDGIFSQACGIIATTGQMLRIGNNKDVRTITSEEDAQWTSIAIGENAGAPTALNTVTSTNQAQDITKNNGGHFYVLTASAGLDQSRINRFAVQPLNSDEAMSSTTVQAFDDLFVKNIPSFLLSFGGFRSKFATDGALYFATRNQNNDIAPIAMITPAFPVPRVGVPNVGDRSSLVNINFQQGTEINYFDRSAPSGSWIAAGNFNTQVLE